MIPKNFSLALGGGAARGLSQIGVLRYLEEHDVTPYAVAGTSMGAIIATLTALGKTSHDMENILSKIKWLSIIDFDLKTGLLKGKKIEEFLEHLFEGKTFSDTKIPLKIVTTDIQTGETVILDTGSLARAVRGSIGIAGVFIPYKYGQHDLIDGGFSMNLPIEILPEGPVIAVSAMRNIQSPLEYKRKIFSLDWQQTIFSNGYTIMRKAIEILVSQNEVRSVLSRDEVQYIRPEFDDLDYYAFLKYKAFIKSGYDKAKEVLDQK